MLAGDIFNRGNLFRIATLMNDETRMELAKGCIGMLDFQRVVTLCHLLLQTQSVPGAVCEFGCFAGGTSSLMASLTTKDVWLYDSFSGLPQPGPHDTNRIPFVKGAMAVSRDKVENTFEFNGLKPPTIIGKEFRHLTPADLPESIAFAHVDCDLYDGTKKVMDLIWPFVSHGGVVVVDDFNHPELPGVKNALLDSEISYTIVEPMAVNGAKSIHCYFTKL